MSTSKGPAQHSGTHGFAVGASCLALFLALFGALLLMGYLQTTESTGMLWWREERAIDLGERIPYLQGAIALWVGAIALGTVAVWLLVATPERRRKRLKRYLPILKGIESMPIHQIASITNSNPSVVLRDIQTMIDSGMVDDVYVDYQASVVVSKRYVPATSHKTVVQCSQCGANAEVIVGITRSCAYCGQPLVL